MKPYYAADGITIYHGDCREILPVLRGVCITDPPYGTEGWRRISGGAGSNPAAGLARESWDDGAVDWIALTDCTAILAFWPAARTRQLLEAANEHGLVKHRALYMRKRDPKPQVAGRIAWSVEPIWCLSPDGFLLHGGTDWYEDSTPRLGRDADATGHPYQKPLAIMEWLVGKTVGAVLDPFCGSGTTLVAAKNLCRSAVGVEANERWCEIAAKRLIQGVLDFGGVA